MPWLAVCSFPGWPTGPQHVPAHPSLPVDNSHWPFSLLQPGGDFLSYISFSPLLITTYAQFSENYIIVAPYFLPAMPWTILVCLEFLCLLSGESPPQKPSPSQSLSGPLHWRSPAPVVPSPAPPSGKLQTNDRGWGLPCGD